MRLTSFRMFIDHLDIPFWEGHFKAFLLTILLQSCLINSYYLYKNEYSFLYKL